MDKADRKTLLRDILKGVSRSFYLTLWVIPAKARDPLGLAYLFCRAADTLADTDLLPPTERLKCLYLFREQFQHHPISWESISELRARLVPHQGNPSERILLERLADCFRIFETFSSQDQDRIRNLVSTLTRGMEMDLTRFPAEDSGRVNALASPQELDQYCYYVAGVVGEFWTSMLMAHFPSLRGWEAARMCKLGVHFGKGLQMTNILKDLSKDLARGRCYLPQEVLDQFNLTPQTLKEPGSMKALRPLLASQIRLALYHLEGGWQYILAIPRQEVRLRLACLWPHLFAVRTLELIYHAEDLLNPRITVKISRREVYITMAMTTLLSFSNRLLTRYYERLKCALISRVAGD